MRAFKFLHDFRLQHMFKTFAENSLFTEHSACNTAIDLKFPLRKSTVGQRYYSCKGGKVWNTRIFL